MNNWVSQRRLNLSSLSFPSLMCCIKQAIIILSSCALIEYFIVSPSFYVFHVKHYLFNKIVSWF